MKKVTITVGIADHLSDTIEHGIGIYDDPARLRSNIKMFNPTGGKIHNARLPDAVVAGIIARCEEIIEVTSTLRQGNCNRDDAQAVVDAYQALDRWLDKSFKVVPGPADRTWWTSKKPYRWEIGC